MTESFWTWRRATAAKGIAAAVLTFPFAVWGLYRWWPVSYADEDRLGVITLAMQWMPLVGVFLFFMFTQTARLFDTKGAEEVLAGKESTRWKKNARIYSNSVEQALTFATMLAGLAAVVPASQAAILPVLVTLWLFGRVTFFIAYHIDPAYRAFGFDYTLFPSLTAAGWFLVTIGS